MQKPLKKGAKIKVLGKKARAPSRIAATASKTGKGKLSYTNSKLDKASASEAKDITRLINERNELEYARKATQSGGSLTVIRPPPEAPKAKPKAKPAKPAA